MISIVEALINQRTIEKKGKCDNMVGNLQVLFTFNIAFLRKLNAMKVLYELNVNSQSR